MLFLKLSFIIILSVYCIMLFVFCLKSGKLLKTLLLSALSGIVTLAAVNILSRYSGVYIAVNAWTVGASSLFGLPGVIGLLTVRMFF